MDSSANEADTKSFPKKKRKKAPAQLAALEQQPQSASTSVRNAIEKLGLREKLCTVLCTVLRSHWQSLDPDPSNKIKRDSSNPGSSFCSASFFCASLQLSPPKALYSWRPICKDPSTILPTLVTLVCPSVLYCPSVCPCDGPFFVLACPCSRTAKQVEKNSIAHHTLFSAAGADAHFFWPWKSSLLARAQPPCRQAQLFLASCVQKPCRIFRASWFAVVF